MIEIIRRIQDSVVENILAQLVLQTGDLGGVVEHLKRSVVRLAQERSEAPKEYLSQHFGKSERWFYRYLEEPREGREGSRDLHAVINALIELSPTPCSPAAVLSCLKEARPKLTLHDMNALLEFYASIELIQRLPQREGHVCYALLERNQVYVSDGNEDVRRERFERTCAYIPALARSYIQGDEGARIGVANLSVSPNEWLSCMKDIEKFNRRRIHEAVERSLEEDPDELTSKRYAFAFMSGQLD